MTSLPPSSLLGADAMLDLPAIVESLREGIQVIDRQWRYRYLNLAAASHGRRPREELLGRTMMECYPGIDGTEAFKALRRCMEERTVEALENDFSYPDGTTRTFELRVEPCAAGIVVLSIDVTERVKVQEQLLHSQKLDAIGRLAGGVAHDFNNYLTVISANAAFLADTIPEEGEAHDDLEAIQECVRRAAALTGQLLAFARKQVASPQVLDLNAVVLGMDKMFRRLLGEDIDIATLPDPGLWKTRVDAGHVEQLLANLLVNARDAMPRGGKLTVETKNVVLDEEYARQHADAKAGEHVMLAVSDTGEGMDATTRARIFEPFFTTKGRGRGTGIGLATCYGIVKQAGGNIWVYSEVGKGSTFKVYLPRSAGAEVGTPIAAELHALSGTETVLLVEDEAAVRAAAARVLQRLGHEVLEAASSQEALEIAARMGTKVDLLMTDVVLPGMGGRELAQRFSALHPGARILFMSGYTDNAVVLHELLEEGIPFLQKPFTPDTLGRKVREVLSGAEEPSRTDEE